MGQSFSGATFRHIHLAEVIFNQVLKSRALARLFCFQILRYIKSIMFRELIKKEIQNGVGEGVKFSVEVPENPEHGDYASNVALILGKQEGNPPAGGPREIAEDVVLRIRSGQLSRICEKVEIAGPGFLNFWVSRSALAVSLQGILKNEKAWGTSDAGKKKKVVVEYFPLNIAKRPHIGHIRSAVIGDSLKRMLLSQGYDAISDTHVGDWGTQFGILLLAWKNSGPSLKELETGDPFSVLEDLYIAENERIEKEPERREQAKKEFANLEKGDKESRKIWEHMVLVSMKKLEESARRLGLLKFDEHKGESSYEKDMPPIVEEALKKGVAQKKDDGAVTVDLTSEKLDEAVLVKSDGASTYLLRDLATIKYRKAKHRFWKNLYVTDVRQEHHFRQVFRVAEKLGYDGVNDSLHVSFGFMSVPEGAISTRKGTAIALDAVIDEAISRAKKVIEEKNPDLLDKENVARMVGIGALKYFDLSHNRNSDIIFKWDDALSFEGNTGPYLQYTYARLKSILRKAGSSTNLGVGHLSVVDDMERQLLAMALRFPEAIEDSLSDFLPNILANYIFELAQKANEFYHSHPVMQESDETKKNTRLALIVGVATTIKNGLYLLGVDSPEEM